MVDYSIGLKIFVVEYDENGAGMKTYPVSFTTRLQAEKKARELRDVMGYPVRITKMEIMEVRDKDE